jgi:hypothetical protein
MGHLKQIYCVELVGATAAASTATGATAAGKARAALCRGGMAGISNMAVTVAGFVAVEVLERGRAALRKRTVVAVVRVEAVIYVAVKAVRTVEPGAGTEKDATDEPVRSVVAVGRAVIRRVVEVTIGADGGRAKVDAD